MDGCRTSSPYNRLFFRDWCRWLPGSLRTTSLAPCFRFFFSLLLQTCSFGSFGALLFTLFAACSNFCLRLAFLFFSLSLSVFFFCALSFLFCASFGLLSRFFGLLFPLCLFLFLHSDSLVLLLLHNRLSPLLLLFRDLLIRRFNTLCVLVIFLPKQHLFSSDVVTHHSRQPCFRDKIVLMCLTGSLAPGTLDRVKCFFIGFLLIFIIL